MLCLMIRDTITTVEGIDFCFIIHDFSKYDAIHLLENSVLDDDGYIKCISKKSILRIESLTII